MGLLGITLCDVKTVSPRVTSVTLDCVVFGAIT